MSNYSIGNPLLPIKSFMVNQLYSVSFSVDFLLAHQHFFSNIFDSSNPETVDFLSIPDIDMLPVVRATAFVLLYYRGSR